MRINQLTKYPHPILSSENTDYVAGLFEVEISVDEDSANNSLLLQCDVTLNEGSIKSALTEESAKIGIDVHCGDTYRNSIHTLTLGENTIKFETGVLSGRVVIRPMIWTTIAIEGFYSSNFNPEYDDQTFSLDLGDLLAWDIEQIVSIGQKKLAPMDSIFQLARNEEIEDGQFDINIEGEKIQINASGKTYDHIHQQRQTSIGQAIVLNSVYFPTVIQVLTYLKKSGEGDYADRDWYQVFIAKCNHLNLDPQSTDVLSNASQLLNSPYTKVMESFSNE